MNEIDNDANANLIDDAEEATIGMTEIDGFDFERAAMLMSIMEKVANVAPKAQAISGIAAAALNEMAEEAKAIAKRRAEEMQKAEAQARANAYEAGRPSEPEEEPVAEERLQPPARTPRAIPAQAAPLAERRV